MNIVHKVGSQIMNFSWTKFMGIVHEVVYPIHEFWCLINSGGSLPFNVHEWFMNYSWTLSLWTLVVHERWWFMNRFMNRFINRFMNRFMFMDCHLMFMNYWWTVHEHGSWKFRGYMYFSKVNQVSSNQVCLTYCIELC